MPRKMLLLVGAGLWITACAGLYAGVAVQKPRRVTVALEVEPSAPVADRLPQLVRESLSRQPAEPIPIGELGPFGVGASEDDTAPVAPASFNLLELNDADADDASAPVEAR